MAALAYWPMSRPALKLSVAKRASVAFPRIGRRIERDHQHAGRSRFPDRRDDGLGVARGDENRLRARRHHVLDRGDLARVVAVEPAGGGQQLCASGFGGLCRALPHLHEEGVGLGLGDEADDGLLLRVGWGDGASQDQGQNESGGPHRRRGRLSDRSDCPGPGAGTRCARSQPHWPFICRSAASTASCKEPGRPDRSCSSPFKSLAARPVRPARACSSATW